MDFLLILRIYLHVRTENCSVTLHLSQQLWAYCFVLMMDFTRHVDQLHQEAVRQENSSQAIRACLAIWCALDGFLPNPGRSSYFTQSIRVV